MEDNWIDEMQTAEAALTAPTQELPVETDAPKAEVITEPASQVEEPTAEVAPEVEVTEEPEHDLDWYKTQFETAEKRRRDLQSYYQKQLNEKSSQQLSISEADIDALEELFLTDPEEARARIQSYMAPPSTEGGQEGEDTTQQIVPVADQTDHRFLIHEEMEREKHTDYDEKMETLQAIAAQNPSILDSVRSAPNKARAAYELAVNLSEVKAFAENPQAYREKIKAEVLAQKNQTPEVLPSISSLSSSAPPTSAPKAEEKNIIEQLFG